MAEKRRRLLRKPVLRLEQNRSHPLYLLSLTAEEIVAVADISRLSRSDGGQLLGYQRGEVRRHIQDIVAYHNLSTSETDFDSIWAVLLAYWSAVRATFPDAWGKPPARSRLMHGTGIRAMGRLMDRVVSAFHPREPDLRGQLERELRKIAPVCRWTSGRWEELDLDWREVQNVPRHLRLLSSLLVRAYLQARGGGP